MTLIKLDRPSENSRTARGDICALRGLDMAVFLLLVLESEDWEQLNGLLVPGMKTSLFSSLEIGKMPSEGHKRVRAIALRKLQW